METDKIIKMPKADDHNTAKNIETAIRSVRAWSVFSEHIRNGDQEVYTRSELMNMLCICLDYVMEEEK